MNFFQLTVATDFHSTFFHIMKVSDYHQMSGYPHSSKYLLCSLQQKREIHTGLEQLQGEYMTTMLILWRNYPFNNKRKQL